MSYYLAQEWCRWWSNRKETENNGMCLAPNPSLLSSSSPSSPLLPSFPPSPPPSLFSSLPFVLFLVGREEEGTAVCVCVCVGGGGGMALSLLSPFLFSYPFLFYYSFPPLSLYFAPPYSPLCTPSSPRPPWQGPSP